MRHILRTNCKVRILHYRDWRCKLSWSIRLLKWAADSLEELHLPRLELEVPLMAVIAEMPHLKVLSFNPAWRKGCEVLVFPAPQPETKRSLQVFRAEGWGGVLPRTVHSAMVAYTDTLRVLQFSCAFTSPILRVMANCRALRELHISCQRNLGVLTTAAPLLQRLILVLNNTVQDPPHLRILPEHVSELVLIAPRRISLVRDLEALAEGCKALLHLKTITIHSQDWRKNILPDVHRQFLLRQLPKVEVSFVQIGRRR